MSIFSTTGLLSRLEIPSRTLIGLRYGSSSSFAFKESFQGREKRETITIEEKSLQLLLSSGKYSLWKTMRQFFPTS
jgi:hypothetical protein